MVLGLGGPDFSCGRLLKVPHTAILTRTWDHNNGLSFRDLH